MLESMSVLRRDTLHSQQDPLSTGTTDPLRVLTALDQERHSFIGRSYYYIRSGYGSNSLYHMIYGFGGIFSDEPVAHHPYGISWDDLDDAVSRGEEIPEVPGYYFISPLIEKKLRALLDA
ncbi:MAG: hypothetical protein LUQ25_09750 [Methanoregulaceae archaeon]|nr:hypothetical protein [Methanoregulaceae archaeon]